ncbi:hypothetical protein OIO90_002240 [Microbotryomycetes sp. JL221]|nr:hypothetical protein OIO90_002240 [Microbotryomycetes sp. JL221]
MASAFETFGTSGSVNANGEQSFRTRDDICRKILDDAWPKLEASFEGIDKMKQLWGRTEEFLSWSRPEIQFDPGAEEGLRLSVDFESRSWSSLLTEEADSCKLSYGGLFWFWLLNDDSWFARQFLDLAASDVAVDQWFLELENEVAQQLEQMESADEGHVVYEWEVEWQGAVHFYDGAAADPSRRWHEHRFAESGNREVRDLKTRCGIDSFREKFKGVILWRGRIGTPHVFTYWVETLLGAARLSWKTRGTRHGLNSQALDRFPATSIVSDDSVEEIWKKAQQFFHENPDASIPSKDSMRRGAASVVAPPWIAHLQLENETQLSAMQMVDLLHGEFAGAAGRAAHARYPIRQTAYPSDDYPLNLQSREQLAFFTQKWKGERRLSGPSLDQRKKITTVEKKAYAKRKHEEGEERDKRAREAADIPKAEADGWAAFMQSGISKFKKQQQQQMQSASWVESLRSKVEPKKK